MEPQQNRACDACRKHKVRCFPDNSATSKICQRCARTDRNCVYTVPQKRKQRKRTDTRVAELEREVQAMRALFEGKKDKAQAADESQLTSNPAIISQHAQSSMDLSAAILGEFSSSEPPRISDRPLPLETTAEQGTHLRSHATSERLDVIDKGYISTDLAIELFHTYVTELVPHYPAVIFPAGVSALEIRRTKPTLFLAIIAAAAGKLDPSLYSTLNAEVISEYAQQVVIGSQKSLELVQAMIVTSVWYYPPGKFAQLKFYEYIHMAAAMALDIGIGTNPKMLRRRQTKPDKDSSNSDETGDGGDEEIEKRRTFLACYLITTGVAMSMRRPAILHYTNWVADCLEYLETSLKSAPSDKLLVGWVKLLTITEEVSTSLSFDDPGNMPSLSEPRVNLMLKSFERRLESWRDGLDHDGVNDALLLAYHHNDLYLHELAMHEDHPPEDFLPPFTIDHILLPDPERKLTSSYVDAISVCVSTAHSLIEVMLGMSVEALRALPIFNFARMAYACVVLTKLYVSVRCRTSEIGKVLDREMLRIGFYLPAMIKRLSEAVGSMKCRSPATFLGLLVRLYAWYENQEIHDEFTEPVKLFGPKFFTPSESDYSKSPRDVKRTADSSVSGLIQIRAGHQPAVILGANFDRSDPFGTFLTPRQESINDLSYTAHRVATPTEPVELEDNFLFYSTEFDFEMDPYFYTDGMEFSNAELNDWPPSVGLSR